MDDNRPDSPTVRDIEFEEHAEIPENIEEEYDHIDGNFSVENGDLVDIINKLWESHYKVRTCSHDDVYATCKSLFEKDYHCEIVDNFGGVLCENYPVRLIVPVAKKAEENNGSFEFDKDAYYQKVHDSTASRCRARFVAPVIFLDGKFICRSGTLSNRKTAVYETATKAEPPQTQYAEENVATSLYRSICSIYNSICHKAKNTVEAAGTALNPNSMEALRQTDKRVLQICNVTWICDLMVETKKVYMKTITVSSSEKANAESYSEFGIEIMPYPGCEFFKRYSYSDFIPDGLIFDWNRADINIELQLTEYPSTTFPDIKWEDYKKWDIATLTQNYLKALLTRLAKDPGSLLVHCISGWDRTPLMISLLRVSLWADGVIHNHLNDLEMAYLTLAYDWFLFGHDFPTRHSRREEIMHFCFNFLTSITSDDFSITRLIHDLSPEQKAGRDFPNFVPGRRRRLETFSKLVLRYYEEKTLIVQYRPNEHDQR